MLDLSLATKQPLPLGEDDGFEFFERKMVEIRKSVLRGSRVRHLVRTYSRERGCVVKIKRKNRRVINLPSVEPQFVPACANRSLPATSITALSSATRFRSRPSATRSDRALAALIKGTSRHHPTREPSADLRVVRETQTRARKMGPAPASSVPDCSGP